MSAMDIYDDMNLYVTYDKFRFFPNGKTNEELTIDRRTGEATINEKAEQIIGLPLTRRICGILGTIKLISARYLIVATHRVYIGLINGQIVYQLAGYDIIPYIPSLDPQNEIYLSMIRKLLNTPFFYFSYTYDLTHSLQRLHPQPPEFLNMGLFERADQRFVWNGYLLKNLQKYGLKQYCLPLIHGFISVNQVSVNNNFFTWILISRRSIQRAGTRLFCRGIDSNGYCANFVETEQIVEYLGDKTSFVQTRGSIPLFWLQTPNLHLKPKPQIDITKNHLSAASRHFDLQLQTYGRHVLVNLIDHRGAEEKMEKGYSNLMTQMGNTAIRYESFDFHSECRKMRWDRLNILIDRLAHEQDEFSIFHLRRDGVLLSFQDGVFRTNCIDCLDRTNVVQSMLAKRSLTFILTKLGILSPGQTIESTIGLEYLFKNVWADNADLISLQYSGTGALKTDFTRTGKRSMMGALKDGYNSLIRYYKNNFNDGFRQDSIELLLGNYVVQDGEGKTVPCPLTVDRGYKKSTLITVLIFAFAMFTAAVRREYNTENMLYLLFWGAMIGGVTKIIFTFSGEFVDWPKLIPYVNGRL